MQVAIAYIPEDTTEADVAQFCAAFSSVDRVEVAASASDQHPRVAIVSVDDPDEATAAIVALDTTEFLGHLVRVRKASPTDLSQIATPGEQPGSTEWLGAGKRPPIDLGEFGELLDTRPGGSRQAAHALWGMGRVGLYGAGAILLLTGYIAQGIATSALGIGRRACQTAGWRDPALGWRSTDAAGHG